MAIAYRTSNLVSAGSQSGTSQALNVPIGSSVQGGDALIVVVGVNDNKVNYQIVPPGGVTLLDTIESGSSYANVYFRTAASGDASTNLTFSLEALAGGTGARCLGGIIAMSGALLSVHSGMGFASSTATHATPSMTPASYPAHAVIACVKKSSSLTTITSPAGYTQRQNTVQTGGGNLGLVIAEKAIASGATDGGAFVANAASAAAETFTVTLVETPPPAAGAVPMQRSGGAWGAGTINKRGGGTWTATSVKLRSGGAWL